MRFYDYWSAAEFEDELTALREQFSGFFIRLNHLREAIEAAGDRLAVGQLYYLARLAELENRINTLTKRRANVAVFHEPFFNLASFDQDAVSGTPADVISNRGLLVLNRTEEKAVEIAELTVIRGNGLPGNTHQVYPGSGIYCGAEDPHLDLGAIVDGIVNTWFEYERLTGMAGIKYAYPRYLEGYPWLWPHREALEMVLEARLAERQMVNWITVDPFLPAERGYVPPVLSLLLDDQRGHKQELTVGQLAKTAFITSAPQDVQTITFSFRQPVPYPVSIGMPENKLSLQELGLSYDSARQVVEQPAWRSGEGSPDWSELRSRLAKPAAQTALALRYQLGLRSIQAGVYRYGAAATYISHPYPVAGEIIEARLTVSAEVGDLLSGYPCVRAFLSVDDGVSWLPVQVPGLPGNEPAAYAFGRYVPEAVWQPGTVYIGNQRPTMVRVRLDLSRPDTGQDYETYLSPVVKEYTLEVTVA